MPQAIYDSISLQISYQMRFQYRPGIALLTDGGINNMFMIEQSKVCYLCQIVSLSTMPAKMISFSNDLPRDLVRYLLS